MEKDFRYKLEHMGDNFVAMFATKKDFRYKLEHMGDYFAAMLSKVTCASKSSARGVILTYDIRQLTKKKETLIRDIGTRVARICRDNPSLVQDEKVIELLGWLAE